MMFSIGLWSGNTRGWIHAQPGFSRRISRANTEGVYFNFSVLMTMRLKRAVTFN